MKFLNYYFFLLSLTSLLDFVISRTAETRFYKILDVDPDASQEDIKKAYRRLARKLHPDKNRDNPEATAEFAELHKAYEVLNDPEKRKRYDSCGESCVKDDKPSGGDPLSSFFGFHFGDEDGGQRETPRGATITMDVFVTLEELYNGNFIEITRNKLIMKPTSGTRKCNCRQEMTTRQLGPGRFQMIQQTVCDECPNVMRQEEERTLELEVEQGMADGHKIKFNGEGESHIDGDPGDLIMQIKTLPHPVFERRGDDLYTNVTVSLQDALTGFSLEIEHLDGKKVKVSRDKVTWPGARIRKKNEGMPVYNSNKHGTLYITFDIEFPKADLSEEDKEGIKRILKQQPVNNVYNGLRGF
uniref:DNAJ n=1 Tax=Sogatella furcifera TaxID=113103 RepID=A0A6M3B5N2_SOGFU|nr:DNAJ [Sogatella furcifera]